LFVCVIGRSSLHSDKHFSFISQMFWNEYRRSPKKEMCSACSLWRWDLKKVSTFVLFVELLVSRAHVWQITWTLLLVPLSSSVTSLNERKWDWKKLISSSRKNDQLSVQILVSKQKSSHFSSHI
jgi:hypothetical protein